MSLKSLILFVVWISLLCGAALTAMTTSGIVARMLDIILWSAFVGFALCSVVWAIKHQHNRNEKWVSVAVFSLAGCLIFGPVKFSPGHEIIYHYSDKLPEIIVRQGRGANPFADPDEPEEAAIRDHDMRVKSLKHLIDLAFASVATLGGSVTVLIGQRFSR